MMHQSEWCRQDLIQLDLYCTIKRIVESNDYICIEHLRAFSPWTMMMNLNTNMNNNLTQMSSLVLVCLLGNGHGPSCKNFYLVIPGTEYSQTHLFLISGNDKKCC